jgi:hypothetical protein
MRVELKDILPEAICHICGEPMKVLHHEHRALALGFKIPEGGIFTIECHGFQLRIEDEEAEREVVKLLEAYHSSKESEEPVIHVAEGVGHPQRA